MAPRFSRARLTDANDPQYRAFLRQIMIGKDNQRPTRPPLPRELFGGEVESFTSASTDGATSYLANPVSVEATSPGDSPATAAFQSVRGLIR